MSKEILIYKKKYFIYNNNKYCKKIYKYAYFNFLSTRNYFDKENI